MANPSLQIGNGKFAIKENELLGYSSSGTRFFPIPITMTRATLGTRVNPSGLIEDVELLGSEEVENGDGSSTTGWGLAYANTTLSINNNNLRATANGSGAYGLSQDLSLDTNKQYIIKATINVDNASGGAANLRIATNSNLSSNVTTLSSTTGTTTTILSPSATTMYIGIVDTANDSSNYVEIDNISVKEVTRDGLARVDYTDGTGSLLVEPQRTNLVTYSEDFSQSFWTPTRCTITSNQIISPNGTLDADLLTATDTSENYIQTSNTVAVSGTSQTVSFYVKKGTSDFAHILLWDNSSNGARQWFDLTNGTIGTSTSFGSGITVNNANMISYSNDWYRCVVVFSNSTANIKTRISASNSNGGTTSTVGKTIYIWGSQLEEGSYPTSYIKTQGSTVTRNKDEYTKTGISDKINSDEGVLFLEMAALSDDLTFRSISLNDGTNTNSVGIRYRTNSNRINAIIKDDNGVTFQMNFDVSDITQFNKIALKYKSGDNRLYINGTEVSTNSSTFSFTSALNDASFNRGDGNDDFYGKVRQLQVYKTALSDSELATLTTI
jgi:hypothetical protein